METTNDLLRQLATMSEHLSSTGGTPVDALHMAVGFIGEAGEVLEQEKKAYFQCHEIDDVDLATEVGDAMFYLLGLLRIRDISFSECLVAVLAKLRHRYPGGMFDPEQSQNRDKIAERQAAIRAIKRWREGMD